MKAYFPYCLPQTSLFLLFRLMHILCLKSMGVETSTVLQLSSCISSLVLVSTALKLCNYKKMGHASEKKAVDLVWFSALVIQLVSRIIMTQNAEISI